MNPDQERALRALVAEWRAQATELNGLRDKVGYETRLRYESQAAKADDCAGELEAALAASPSQVEPLSAAPETEEYAKVIAERDALRKFIHELRLAMEGRLGPGEPLSADAPAPQYPKPCGLCEKQIESADETEWHGLGNCVPLCERCMGSGIDPNDNLKITTAEAKELAAMDKRGAKFVQSAPAPSEERLREALAALQSLLSACEHADFNGDLSEYVDGSLLDAARAALAELRGR